MEFIEQTVINSVNILAFHIGQLYRIRFTARADADLDFLCVCSDLKTTDENDEDQPYADFTVFKWLSQPGIYNIFRLAKDPSFDINSLRIDEIELEEVRDLMTMETHIRFPKLRIY